jgi:hypothetical protein
MDIQKLTFEIYEFTKQWHLPLLVGFIGLAGEAGKPGADNGLGEAPGDNILPKQILICLSSRRGSKAAF